MKLILLISILISLSYCIYSGQEADIEDFAEPMCFAQLSFPVLMSGIIVAGMKKDGKSDKEIERAYLYGEEAHDIFVDVMSKALDLEGASDIEFFDEMNNMDKNSIDYSDLNIEVEDAKRLMGIIPKMSECVETVERFLKSCEQNDIEFDPSNTESLYCLDELRDSSEFKKLGMEAIKDFETRSKNR
jgi:hypothetical protein